MLDRLGAMWIERLGEEIREALSRKFKPWIKNLWRLGRTHRVIRLRLRWEVGMASETTVAWSSESLETTASLGNVLDLQTCPTYQPKPVILATGEAEIITC